MHENVYISRKNLLSARKPAKVILDSSFLFTPTQFHIDIFEELATLLNRRFDPIILSPTWGELQGIAERGSMKLRRQAALALELADKCRMVEVAKDVGELHDDLVVRVAVETASYVATNDRALRKRLRSVNVPVIYLRQKSRLALDGASKGA
jgi:rRNA-processing protein FCF1